MPRIIEPPKRAIGDPFQIGTRRISLPELPVLLRNCITRERESTTGYISIVYGSGISRKCVGVVGLISDALGIPEITAAICSVVYKGHNVNVRSFLDLDLAGEIEKWKSTPEKNLPDRPNLILCGTGDVNWVVQEILLEYERHGSAIRPGPIAPNRDEFIGYKGITSYVRQSHPHSGCLLALRNPWLQDRLVIICGGMDCIGTVASLWTLHKFLTNSGNEFGNNKYDSSIPCKIVEGISRAYDPELIYSVDDRRPKVSVASLEPTLRPVEILE